jgi:hypothetical protein
MEIENKELFNKACEEGWEEYLEDGINNDRKQIFKRGFKEGLEWLMTEIMILKCTEKSSKLFIESIKKLEKEIFDYVSE